MEKCILYTSCGAIATGVSMQGKKYTTTDHNKRRGGVTIYIVSSKPLLYGRVAKCAGEIESALGTKMLHGTMGLASTLSVYIIIFIIIIFIYYYIRIKVHHVQLHTRGIEPYAALKNNTDVN